MFNFVKDFIANKEAIKEYKELLDSFLLDGKLDENEKNQLDLLAKKFSFKKEDLLKVHKNSIAAFYGGILSDERISEEEKKDLQSLMNHFGIKQDEIKFNQNEFNKYYSLALIDSGVLPTPQVEGLNIILKKGEVVHWLCPATLKKQKNITQQIVYRGLTTSIKIAKGVRYRVGSIKMAPKVKEMMIEVDSGNLWFTNKRVGFLGSRKNFSFPYSKILSFDFYQDGLSIHKEGKDNPYIIGLVEAEVPAAILSHILNP